MAMSQYFILFTIPHFVQQMNQIKYWLIAITTEFSELWSLQRLFDRKKKIPEKKSWDVYKKSW